MSVAAKVSVQDQGGAVRQGEELNLHYLVKLRDARSQIELKARRKPVLMPTRLEIRLTLAVPAARPTR